MAQVTIGSQELQNNVSPLDAEVMIELLQRLAVGINAIDSDQINAKAILNAALGDGAVDLRTLSSGIMRYDTLTADIDFETAAYRVVNNTFTQIKSLPDGLNKLEIEVVPPQDCYCQVIAKMRFDYKVDAITRRMYFDVFDQVSSAALVEFESDPLAIPVNEDARYSIDCIGVCELNAGQTYRLIPRFKWIDDSLASNLKAQVKVLNYPKNTHFSALLLPRTT